MAQPSHFRIQYLGSVEVEANKQYSAFDGTSSLTYVFNQKCLIAICSNLDVA
jgi:hypothetical protein